MRAAKRLEFQVVLAALLGVLGGCEFFDDDDSDFGDESGESGDGDGDTGEPPPSQGFRVFPKFMLQDVPAIVTIDLDGVSSTACELDGAPEGGYVCDAGDLPNGSFVTIRVERDGFDMAVRHPEIPFSQIMPLDVHLAIEGGPTGTWSACAVAGDFTSCDDLCASVAGTCMVTSCATADPEWPIASHESFTDGQCLELIESVAAECAGELPLAGAVGSIRCCCSL